MKHKYKDGGSAFPYSDTPDEDGTIDVYTGMSKRDWFAGQAIIGLMAHHGRHDFEHNLAKVAYEIADQMLEVRHSSNQDSD